MRVPSLSTFAFLLSLVFVASVGCSKKIDPSKITKTTIVDNNDLRVALDGDWHSVAIDHGYDLRNEDGTRQIIATIVPTEPTALADRRPTLEKLVAIRRDVMGLLSDGGAAPTTATYETNGDRMTARFHGKDPMHDAFTSFFLVATSTNVITIGYYEYKRPNERDAEARAQTVFASVVAK